jgi:LPXTG-motif cell wall-anchored protein
MTRTYRLPALLWFTALALCVVQVVLVLTDDASVPLGIAIGVLFLAAAALTLTRRR